VGVVGGGTWGGGAGPAAGVRYVLILYR
jgi:hypothetical protein